MPGRPRPGRRDADRDAAVRHADEAAGARATRERPRPTAAMTAPTVPPRPRRPPRREAAAQLSEAQAELAAQQLERERIERRKAEKAAPIAAGAKLSGQAADLLAAVRAVEGGATPPAAVFGEEPARRAAPRRSRSGDRSRRTPRPRPTGSRGGRRRAASGACWPRAARPRRSRRPPPCSASGAEASCARTRGSCCASPVCGPSRRTGSRGRCSAPECAPDDERRGRALAVWLLEQAALAGHTALELPTLRAALARQTVPDPDAAVQGALAEGEVLVFQDALDAPAGRRPTADAETGDEGEEGDEEAARPVRVLLGLDRYALAEESLADGLARARQHPGQGGVRAVGAAAAAPRPARRRADPRRRGARPGPAHRRRGRPRRTRRAGRRGAGAGAARRRRLSHPGRPAARSAELLGERGRLTARS